MRYRKFSPIDRGYPVFELLNGDIVLFDISANDERMLEIAFHRPIALRILELAEFESLLKEGTELAMRSIVE